MSICIPNADDRRKFEILSSIVGEREAERDYFEQSGVVRSPEIVMNKLNQRMFESDFMEGIPEEYDMTPESDDFLDSLEKTFRLHNAQEGMRVAARLSDQLGIPFVVVTSAESRKIRNQDYDVPGFYVAGKVYFTEGQFDTETAFHEFAHPIIKAMSKHPEASVLFDKLYSDLLNEPWGKQIIDSLKEDSYYGKNVSTNEFKEEAIVRAMTYIQTRLNTGDINEEINENNSWLKNLLFNIRQFLRKVFGRKINVGNLNLDTTLSDLVDMLNQGDNFKLDIDMLNKDDVLMLLKAYDKEMELTDEASLIKAQAIFNEMFHMVKGQVSKMQPGTLYSRFSEDLVNEDFNGELQKVLKALEKLAATTYNKRVVVPLDKLSDAQEYLDSLNKSSEEVIAHRIAMFVGVMTQADTVIDKFADKIKSLPEKLKDNNDIDITFGISQYVNQWGIFMEKIINHDYDNILPRGEGSLYNFLNELQNKVIKLQQAVDEKLIEGVTDVFYNQLVENHAKQQEEYLYELDKLELAGNMAEYTNLHIEIYGLNPTDYNRLKELEEKGFNNLNQPEKIEYQDLNFKNTQQFVPTREQFKTILLNEFGGSHSLGIFYDGYNATQDKAVGSLFSYLSDKLLEVNGNANKNEADFQNGLLPLLKATGWDKKRHLGENGLGTALSQIDDVGITRNGVVESNQVYAFKNNFINGWEYKLKILENNISLAKTDVMHNPSTENQIKLVRARIEKEKFLRDYMSRDFTDEYYSAQELFWDDIGIKARLLLDRFFEDTDDINELMLDAHLDNNNAEVLIQKWLDYEYMFSRTDKLGNLKTGEDLLIAERLLEYRETDRNFHEFVDDGEKFQIAYDKTVEDLIIKHGIDTPAFKAALDTWLLHNTTIKISDEYFEKRSELVDELNSLLTVLTEHNKSIINIAPLYEELYALIKPSRDKISNQNNGILMTKEVQQKVRDLHEIIEEASKDIVGLSGLTPKEQTTLKALSDKLAYYNRLSNEEMIVYTHLNNKRDEILNELGIDSEDIRRIIIIQNELKGMTSTVSTDFYISALTEVMDSVEETKTMFDNFCSDRGVERSNGDRITNEIINDFINDIYLVDEYLAVNSELQEWFYNNHYVAERYINGDVIAVYNKTSLWSFTSPSLNYYDIHTLNDADGNLVGVVEVDGIPRVPNVNYKVRKVKPEYITQNTERDYIDQNGNLVLANIDNSGRRLPKTVEQGAIGDTYINKEYMNMFNNDRPMWDLLDYVKNHHLDNQLDLQPNQRLGLHYPRVRMGRVEHMGTSGRISRMTESFKNTVRLQEDDIELGINSAVTADVNNRDASDRDLYFMDTLTRPISGMYNLPLNEVSRDIIKSMGTYQYSLEMFKSLSEVNSTSQMVKRMVNHQLMTPAAQEMKRKIDHLRLTSKDPVVNKRAKAVNYILENYFQGLSLHKPSDLVTPKAQKFLALTVRRISKLSSAKWFKYNLFSTLKNYISSNIQMIIKSFDYRYFNHRNYVVGVNKARGAARMAVAQQYSAGVKPALLQFLHVMDASPDKYKRIVGERGSRNILQDTVEGRIGYGDRAYFQSKIDFSVLFALLDKSEYKFMHEGKITSLDKAIHLVDGRIETKLGVPEELSISYDESGRVILGSKIKKVIKLHHAYLKKTTGIGGSLTEGEYMARSLRFKFLFAVMRFLPGMTLDRYQFKMKGSDGNRVIGKRYDWFTGTAERGTFVESLLTTKKAMLLLTDMAKGDFSMNRVKGGSFTSKAAIAATLQLAMFILVDMLIELIQGSIRFYYDEEDSEKYFTFNHGNIKGEDNPSMLSSLRGLSAIPNLPFVDPSYTEGTGYGMNFNVGNYAKLQLLRLSLGVEKENKTFYPTRLFKPVANLLSGTSAATEGILKDAQELLTYMIHSNEDDKDLGQNSGVYTWQQKGGDRWKHIMFTKAMGYNGNMISPVDGIETEMRFVQ